MKYLFILVCIIHVNSYAGNKHIDESSVGIDTLKKNIIIYNNYPDTLKAIVSNSKSPATFTVSDKITLGVLIVTILGLMFSMWASRKQINHMSEQISMLETEYEVASYRYYYDKWLDMEGEFTRDVLLKRFPQLQKEEKKLNEIIHFVKYLDTQLTYQETSKNYSKYYDEYLTIYKILLMDDYQSYWENYVNELFARNSFFTNSINNTIEIIRLSSKTPESEREGVITAFKKKLDEEWKLEKAKFDNSFIDKLAKKKMRYKRMQKSIRKKIRKLKREKEEV